MEGASSVLLEVRLSVESCWNRLYMGEVKKPSKVKIQVPDEKPGLVILKEKALLVATIWVVLRELAIDRLTMIQKVR